MFCLEILLPSLWESWVQSKATLSLVFVFATKYVLYWGGEALAARVGARDHDSVLLKQLGEKEKEDANAPFGGIYDT